MPLTEENIRAVETTADEECVVCDGHVPAGSIAVGIKFKIPLPLGASLDVIKYMHPKDCAGDLQRILKDKVEQARKVL